MWLVVMLCALAPAGIVIVASGLLSVFWLLVYGDAAPIEIMRTLFDFG